MTGRDGHESARPNGATAVAALGVLLALAFGWNFLRELEELSVVGPPVAVFVLGLAMSGALAYVGGIRLRAEFTIAEARRVAAWSYAGTLAVVLVVGFTITIRLAEGRTLAEPRLELLVGAAGGAIAGLVAGYQNVLAHRQVGEAERARDSMAFLNRTLRHEVLNGVQLVSGHASTIDADGATDAVETIEATSAELADLIDDVGRVADVHAGTADLEPVDLATVVAREVDRLESAHPDATFAVDVPDGATVRANHAVEHVFRNLLTNAVEHTGEDPTVHVSADVGPEVVSVEVADDGPGIPDDRKADLFDPKDGGTHGFGLHLVRTLVEGYGGEVSVGDNEPTRTVFAVDLPRPETPSGGMFDGGVGVGVRAPSPLDPDAAERPSTTTVADTDAEATDARCEPPGD